MDYCLKQNLEPQLTIISENMGAQAMIIWLIQTIIYIYLIYNIIVNDNKMTSWWYNGYLDKSYICHGNNSVEYVDWMGADLAQ